MELKEIRIERRKRGGGWGRGWREIGREEIKRVGPRIYLYLLSNFKIQVSHHLVTRARECEVMVNDAGGELWHDGGVGGGKAASPPQPCHCMPCYSIGFFFWCIVVSTAYCMYTFNLLVFRILHFTFSSVRLLRRTFLP